MIPHMEPLHYELACVDCWGGLRWRRWLVIGEDGLVGFALLGVSTDGIHQTQSHQVGPHQAKSHQTTLLRNRCRTHAIDRMTCKSYNSLSVPEVPQCIDPPAIQLLSLIDASQDGARRRRGGVIRPERRFPKAIDELSKLPDTIVNASFDSQHTRLHAKIVSVLKPVGPQTQMGQLWLAQHHEGAGCRVAGRPSVRCRGAFPGIDVRMTAFRGIDVGVASFPRDWRCCGGFWHANAKPGERCRANVKVGNAHTPTTIRRNPCHGNADPRDARHANENLGGSDTRTSASASGLKMPEAWPPPTGFGTELKI